MRKARMKKFKLCSIGMIVSSIAFIACFGCISGNAYANGGLIGGGGSGGGGSGYSTGGGGGCDDTTPTVDCLGTSWIFYKSTGNVAGLSVQPHIDSAASIPKECSEHSDQGGGFWHFGRNSYGLSWNGINYFGDFNNLNDYNTGGGKRGHQDSYNWGATYGSGHYRDRYRTFSDGSLKHELKSGGNVIYKATKYGGDPRYGGQVLEDYKKACIYAGNAPQNCQSVGGDVSWFCYWEDMAGHTLTAYAVTTSGADLNGGNPIGSARVNNGASATVNSIGITGYTFKGWRTNKSSGNPSGGGSYTISSLTSDQTIYAVYERIRVTLKGTAVIENGTSISGKISDVSTTVDYGSKASITRGTSPAYTFLGWKETASASSYASSNTTYTATSLTSNMTRYAVYRINRRTLTAYAVTTSGGDLNGGKAIGSVTVDYGSKASVTRAVYTGYTFKGWRSSKASGTPSGDTIYSVDSLTANTTIYAVYERNHFKARARVFSGEGTSGSPSADTTFVDSSQTKSIEVNCANSGCKVSFDLALKTIAGSGNTQYSVVRTKGSSTSTKTTTPTSPSAPSNGDNGTTLKINGNSYYVETLVPGETVCYQLTFRPYGSLSNDAERTVKACATAKVTYFKGMSSVSPGSILNPSTTTSTGWVNSNTTTKVRTINKECDARTGCDITFTHKLKTDPDNGGSTTYTIERTSNLTQSDLKQRITQQTGNDALVKGATFSGAEKQLHSETLTMYPGMEVCEKLTFKPNNNQVSVPNDVYSQICVTVEGNGQPDDPSNLDRPSDPDKTDDDDLNPDKAAFLNIKVRNKNYSKYNQYQREVYAKPLQNVQYRAVYNPVLQYTYYLKLTKVKIDNKSVAESSSKSLGTLFNNEVKKSQYSYISNKSWNNAFAVQSNDGRFLNEYKYAVGNVELKSPTNELAVRVNDVGINSVNLTEQARTNNRTNVRTTPSQVSFSWDNTSNKTMVGGVSTTQMQSEAYVRVPYNFNITSEIKTPDNTPIPAGEEMSISYDIHVNPRPNPETSDNPNADSYATVVEEAISRLIVYYPDAPNAQGIDGTNGYGNNKDANLCGYYGYSNNDVKCGYITTEHKGNGRLNGGGDMKGATKPVLAKFYARDLKAGSSVCVAAATYPSNSGGYKNWSDIEGSHAWSISKSICYHIAKKPSIEVWGGNTYSAIGIQTSVASKNNLEGYTGYSISQKNGAGTYVFGSFGELAVISRGNVEGFASAAGTGFRTNDFNAAGDARGLWPGTHPNGSNGNNAGARPSGNPGGSFENMVNYCNRVRLSFSNANCGKSGDGGDYRNAGIGDGTNVESNKQDKLAVINRLMIGGEKTILNGSLVINNSSSDYSYSGADNLTISGGAIDSGVKAIHSEGIITITDNIEYGGSYSTLYGVPKIVIYGKEGININCNVSRIDALLISDGEVTTCSDSNDINAEKNSNQLVVNGAIIAKNMIANRTYGAATGANSIIPAEIINFDPTLYLWGSSDVDSGDNSADMDMTYIQELSPRY